MTLATTRTMRKDQMMVGRKEKVREERRYRETDKERERHRERERE